MCAFLIHIHSEIMKNVSDNMTTYCAFLRGVNVKGTTMKMTEVCSVFEKAGMVNVSSVLASGNIIFSSDINKTDLKILLEKAMSVHFNFDVFLFLRNGIEIENIVADCPFIPHPEFHIYSFVGIEGIENILTEEFESGRKGANEHAVVVNQNFYWQVPKGGSLANNFGDVLGKKSLKDKFTSRNLNTIEKILKKIGA